MTGIEVVCIDTNIYSSIMRSDDRVAHLLSQSISTYVSVFVIGELRAGFKGGNRERENNWTLLQFLNEPFVHLINTTIATSEAFATIKHNLKSRGLPIPINDIWIAAHCLELEAPLVTFDKHFDYVEGLTVIHPD